MAKKKSEVNKTKEILDHVKAQPDDRPQAIAEALTARGVETNAQYVSSILSKHGIRTRKKKQRKAKKAAAATATGAAERRVSGTGVGYEQLVEAKKYVNSIGDLSKAKKVLDAFSNLR